MSPSPQAVIRLQGVSKVFPDVPPGTPPALSSLTADVPSGLVVGLVGPDAAGKTTLMRLLAGLLLPTSGSVEVLGRVPGSEASDEAVHDVGYMPQRFGLYEDLSVIDNLNLHAELRGLEGPARQAMFEKLLTFTALKPFTDRLAGKLSGGMKQKLGLACALLTTPRLLLLDEPGVGVDPLSRRELWKMVSELAVGGMSVLWSTAYMDEAERCAHVLMLDQGSLVYQGPGLRVGWRSASFPSCRRPAKRGRCWPAGSRSRISAMRSFRATVSAWCSAIRTTARFPAKVLNRIPSSRVLRTPTSTPWAAWISGLPRFCL